MKKQWMMSTLLVIMAFSALADTETIDGFTWTYRIRDDGAEIYGDYTYDQVYKIGRYTPAVSPRPIGAVTIPNILGERPVTRIGNFALSGCDSLTCVTMPETVTAIGDSAFHLCTMLTDITIPDTVTTIGSSAFSLCAGLTDIIIPNNVTNLGSGVFYGCTNLTSMVIPDNVTYLGSKSFYACTNLVNVILPNGITNISEDTFFDCANLRSVAVNQAVCDSTMQSIFRLGYQSITNVVIREGVTNIGERAFQDCLGLIRVVVPDSVTSIGGSAFLNCYELQDIKLSEVENIEGGAFGNCRTLMDVDISSAKNLANMFYGCYGLRNIVIPQVYCNTNFYRFFSASYQSITNIVVADGVTKLSQGCFSGCEALQTVTLPESLTSVRARAFENCSSLKAVRFLGDAPDVNEDIYYGTSRSLVTYVPEGSVGWAGGISTELPETWPVDDATARAIAYWDEPDESVTATPVVTPRDGTVFDGAFEVSISCATEGAAIYFTTNGTTPRIVDGTLYSGPFVVEGSVRVKAIAIAAGRMQSASVTATLTKVDVLTLPLSLGAEESLVATGGGAEWLPVVDVLAPKGGMAAKSGAIGNDGESWLETTVVGAGTLSFWWRVSCVKDTDGSATWDRLVCEADDKEVGRIDGITEWTRQEVVFRTAGRHKVRWSYVKDGYNDEGDFEDSAWVQGLEWTPEAGDGTSEALYTRDQMHALALGGLVIDVDQNTGLARIGLRLMETADLSKPKWVPVSLTTKDLDIGADGTVGLNVPVESNAGFFKVVADE